MRRQQQIVVWGHCTEVAVGSGVGQTASNDMPAVWMGSEARSPVDLEINN